MQGPRHAVTGHSFATGSRDYSEKTASAIDQEVNRIVSWAHEQAVGLLSEHRPTLDRIAQELRLHERVVSLAAAFPGFLRRRNGKSQG